MLQLGPASKSALAVARAGAFPFASGSSKEAVTCRGASDPVGAATGARAFPSSTKVWLVRAMGAAKGWEEGGGG